MAPRPLSDAVAKITVKALDRKSARLGALLTSWETIIGKTFAQVSLPVKMSRSRPAGGMPGGQEPPAILHLAVPSAWKTEFQHEAPLLISRINSFFGYKAVAELRFSPRSLPAKPVPRFKSAHPDSALNSRDLDAKVSAIDNPELKAALVRLGQAIRDRST